MNPLCLLAFALLPNSLQPAQSLNITSVKSVHCSFLLARVTEEYFPPHDNLCYRFQVAGLLPKDGRINAEVETRLLSSKGKLVGIKNMPLQGFPVAGKRPVTLISHLPLTEALPLGEYTAEVTVTDNVSGSTDKFERRVFLKAPEFAVVAIHLTHDPEGKLPAPQRIQVGQRLCYRIVVVGFDDSQNRVDVCHKAELVDKESGAVLATIDTPVRQPVTPMSTGTVTFTGEPPPILQAGRYVLRSTLTDGVANKTIRHYLDLEFIVP